MDIYGENPGTAQASSGGTPSIKGGGALPTLGPILSMRRL